MARLNWGLVRGRLERATASRLRLALALSSTVVLLALITRGTYAGSGDAVHYMVIAHSVAFDRDFDLANDYGDPAGILQEPPGNHAIAGLNGTLRPVHDVGLPVLAAPYFAIAYDLARLTPDLPESFRRRAKLNEFIALRQLMSLLMIGITAALAIAFFDASWRLTGQKSMAFLWSLAFVWSPPVMSHGYVFLTEIPSALVALLAWSRRDAVCGEQPGRRGFVLGLLTGLLVLLHVRNVGLVVAFGLLVAWRVRGRLSRGAGFAAGLAIMVAGKAALNLQFWGTILTTPHEHLGAWPGVVAFMSGVGTSALGLLLDPRHGLLPWAPVYLLVPAAWLWLARRSRAVAMELLLVVGAYLVFVVNPVTNVHGWRGGWSPAARFLVPITPFAALAVPWLLGSGRRVGIAMAVIGLQLLMDAWLWGHPMAMWSEGPGTSPALTAAFGATVAGWIPAVDQLTGLQLTAAAIVLGLWVVLTRALLRPRENRD